MKTTITFLNLFNHQSENVLLAFETSVLRAFRLVFLKINTSKR